MGQRTTRTARADDYDWIIRVADDWWGRPMTQNLPRLFLDHFHSTSIVVEDDGQPIAFLIGFVSPSQPQVAYVHFIAVHPEHRRGGTASDLYDRFSQIASAAGCTEVRAVTGAINEVSIAFHGRIGFTVSQPLEGYHGPGTRLVTFRRPVSPAT